MLPLVVLSVLSPYPLRLFSVILSDLSFEEYPKWLFISPCNIASNIGPKTSFSAFSISSTDSGAYSAIILLASSTDLGSRFFLAITNLQVLISVF